MGSGAKDFQPNRIYGSNWRGYFGDYGIHAWKVTQPVFG